LRRIPNEAANGRLDVLFRDLFGETEECQEARQDLNEEHTEYEAGELPISSRRSATLLYRHHLLVIIIIIDIFSDSSDYYV
jgi:hypothetical protein